MKRILGAALAAATIVGMAGCSDDTSPAVQSAQQDMAGGTTAGGGGDSGGGIVPGDTASCMAVIQAMGAAAAAVSGQGDAAEFEAMVQGLQNAVPDDLKDDAQIFGQAYSDFLAVMAQHQGDANPMADPAVMAALQQISTPEVEAAANNISAYMDATCPNG
jgi:hypothetical protein